MATGKMFLLATCAAALLFLGVGTSLCRVCICIGPFLMCTQHDVVFSAAATAGYRRIAFRNAAEQSCAAFDHAQLQTIDLRSRFGSIGRIRAPFRLKKERVHTYVCVSVCVCPLSSSSVDWYTGATTSQACRFQRACPQLTSKLLWHRPDCVAEEEREAQRQSLATALWWWIAGGAYVVVLLALLTLVVVGRLVWRRLHPAQAPPPVQQEMQEVQNAEQNV